MFVRASILSFVLGSILGCSDSNHDDKDNIASMFSHQSISKDQFANLAKIPEKADKKREEAFGTFTTRSLVANSLLSNELKDEEELIRRLVDAKSRIVLDVYFNKYLENEITLTAIENYYSQNTELFSEKEYELSYYLLRVPQGADENTVMDDMLSFYEQLVSGSTFDLNEFSVRVSNENILLSSSNAAPAILNALESLEAGEYTRPTRTKRGIQIFKIESMLIKPLKFELVKPNIEYKLRQKVKLEEYQRLVSRIQNS